MKKLALPLSLAMAATLAACAGTHDTAVVGSAENTYVASSGAVSSSETVRPGVGRVMYLTDLTGPVADISAQRVTLRMSDGTSQIVNVRGEQLRMGESIRIRNDNSIRREPSA